MRNQSMYETENVDWEEINNTEDNLATDPKTISGKCLQIESPSNLDLYNIAPTKSNFQHADEFLSVPTISCEIDGDEVNIHVNKYRDDNWTVLSESKKTELKKHGTAMETGLLDCEWDEFGNFELLSSGNNGSTDDFSWFSSPCAYSELNPPNGTSKFYEADVNYFLEDKPIDEVCGHSSFANCSEMKWMDAAENIEDMGQPKSTMSQHQSETGTKSRSSGFSQFLEGHNGHSSSHFYQTSPFNGQVKTDYARMSISGVESERGSNIYPLSNYDEKSGERFADDSSRSASTANCTADRKSEKIHPSTHQVNKSKNPRLCQNDPTSGAEVAEKIPEVSKFEKEYSTVGDKNVNSGLCDDGPLGASCFMKIQDLMDQLDYTTKLCIRDGLYRLARNAEIRGFGSSRGFPIEKEPNQPSEHLVETGTNAIDRSIAQLLFYRASDSLKETRPS